MTNEAVPVPTIPKTGDNNDLPLYAGLGLLSLSAIAGLLLVKKIRKVAVDPLPQEGRND